MANFWKQLAKAANPTVQAYLKAAGDKQTQALEGQKFGLLKQKNEADILNQLSERAAREQTNKLAMDKFSWEKEKDGPRDTENLSGIQGLEGLFKPGEKVYQNDPRYEAAKTIMSSRLGKTPEELAYTRSQTEKNRADTMDTMGQIPLDPLKRKEIEADISYKQAMAQQATDPLKRQQILGDLELQKQKLANLSNRSPEREFKRLPEESKITIKDTATQNAKISNVKNMLQQGLEQFRNETNPDLKVKAGQELLKVINSPMGADAIGAEESKRLGSFLEKKFFNLTQPGSVFGRDLSLFEQQLQGTVNRLDGTIASNKRVIDQAYGRTGQALEAPPGGGFPRQVRKGGQVATISNAAELAEAQAEGWQ